MPEIQQQQQSLTNLWYKVSKGLSKKSIYVLLPIVILIWGLIIYRLLDITGSTESISLTAPIKNQLRSSEESLRDALSLNYEDPFGLETPKRVKPQSKKKTKNRRNRKTNPWPDIKYNGLVRAKKTNKQIAIISIENRQYFFFPEQQHQQIKLLQAWKDSARVSYQDSLIKVIHK